MFEQIEGHVTHDSQILSGISLTNSTVIFAEGDIQRPVKLVLNAPVTALGIQYLLGVVG